MKIRPDCLPCLLHQALQVTRAASEDDWSQRKVLTTVLRGMPDVDWNASPAEILGQILEDARKTVGVSDPFAQKRAQAHKTFVALADTFRERLAEAEEPLPLAITAAAAANVVDEMIFSGFTRDKDPKAIFEACLAAGFASGQVEQLTSAIDRAECILYLVDNAGEVLFDAILIERIRAMNKRVVVATRGEGLLHDATPVECARANLAPNATSSDEELLPLPEDSADGLGPELPDLIELRAGQLSLPRVARSTTLGAALDQSQLVIAKGSAHYETFTAPAHDVVHLLRAKCSPVARSLGVTPGSLVLLHVPPTVTPSTDPDD